MTQKIRLFPYKQGSRSAKALATALGGKVLKLEGSSFRPKASDVIINWGSSRPVPNNPRVIGQVVNVLNSHDDVERATNKLSCFQTLRENGNVTIPEFWTNREEIPNEAFPVVCRTVLTGHSGRGIVIADSREQLVDAPLYTRYVKKAAEFRVHVVCGTVALVQRKVRDNRVAVEDVNWRVRNHANGFIFQRNEVNPEPEVVEQATRAIEAMALDFGAVDIIWNDHHATATVLEINTAPGLEGSTVEDYARAFRSAGYARADR